MWSQSLLYLDFWEEFIVLSGSSKLMTHLWWNHLSMFHSTRHRWLDFPYDDVVTWIHLQSVPAKSAGNAERVLLILFPHYQPFLQGIYWSLVAFSCKTVQSCRPWLIYLLLGWTSFCNKQLNFWWFKTPEVNTHVTSIVMSIWSSGHKNCSFFINLWSH